MHNPAMNLIKTGYRWTSLAHLNLGRVFALTIIIASNVVLFVADSRSVSAGCTYCNDFGFTPDGRECNPFAVCPTPSPTRQLNENLDLIQKLLLIQQMERQNMRSQPAALPPGCYQSKTGLFCYLRVARTPNPNLKKVSFKTGGGRTYTGMYVDCMNRMIGNGKGWRERFGENSLYLKACTDYR
jgi:hypothetical protein